MVRNRDEHAAWTRCPKVSLDEDVTVTISAIRADIASYPRLEAYHR
jgi:hypothetical protein